MKELHYISGKLNNHILNHKNLSKQRRPKLDVLFDHLKKMLEYMEIKSMYLYSCIGKVRSLCLFDEDRMDFIIDDFLVYFDFIKKSENKKLDNIYSYEIDDNMEVFSYFIFPFFKLGRYQNIDDFFREYVNEIVFRKLYRNTKCIKKENKSFLREESKKHLEFINMLRVCSLLHLGKHEDVLPYLELMIQKEVF